MMQQSAFTIIVILHPRHYLHPHNRNHQGEDHTDDVQVLHCLETVAPQVVVRVMRLRLLIRIARCAPPYLVALILSASQVDRSWVATVNEDLAFFDQILTPPSKRKCLPLADRKFLPYYRAFADRPKLWHRRVVNILHCPELRTSAAFQIEATHSLLRDLILLRVRKL